MDNKLKKVDFTSGIRAETIQHNFDVLDGQIKRERRRIGGYGIVEGFEIYKPQDSRAVHISEGVIINKKGEEKLIPGASLSILPLQAEELEVTLEANEAGQVFLPYRPYSAAHERHFDSTLYQNSYPTEELLIWDANDPSRDIRALRVEGNIVTLDAAQWGGRRVTVKFFYTNNRVDTILVDEDGKYQIAVGTSSTSPSHVDLGDYEGYFVIGLVETIIDGTISYRVHKDLRTYRRIYVDENNVLYLNGKPYKDPQFVYFEEPENPKEYDLWYDTENNILKIWIEKNGEYGWEPVNQEKHMPYREVKIFTPEENPDDLQTFLFGEDEPHLHFIPGHNQLEIYIDNAPLMSDQFDEIEGPNMHGKLNNGIGFRLKNPLERPTYVEVRVLHTVQTSNIRRTFQRTAEFVTEGFVFYSEQNEDKIFETNHSFLIGQRQLEVYVEGKKLIAGLEFEELLPDGSVPKESDRKKASNLYRVKVPLQSGDKVSYRITRNIFSYDDVDGLVGLIDEKATSAHNRIDVLAGDLNHLGQNVQQEFVSVNNSISSLSQRLDQQENRFDANGRLKEAYLPAFIKEGLFSESFTFTHAADSLIQVPNIKASDFFIVYYMSSQGNRLLLKDIDYSVQESADGITLALNSELVDAANTVYLHGIRFGI